MSDPNISILSHGKATQVSKTTVPLSTALRDIKGGRWAAEVAKVRSAYREGGKEAANLQKVKLPGHLFAGSFSSRKSDALTTYSGLVIMDFDGLDADPYAIREARATLKADAHTLAVWTSVTGSGLKALFRVSTGPESHRATFKAIANHFADRGLHADLSGSDLVRNCFVSSDPDLHLNSKADVWLSHRLTDSQELQTQKTSPWGSSPPSFPSSQKPASKDVSHRLLDLQDSETCRTSSPPPPPLASDLLQREIVSAGLIPAAKHQTDGAIFGLSRLALKLANDAGRPLTKDEHSALFDTWHKLVADAGSGLLTHSRLEYQLEFERKLGLARTPLGADPVAIAWQRAVSEPLPPEAGEFAECPPLQMLVGLCYQLANASPDHRFYLSSHQSAALVGSEQRSVNRWLNALASPARGLLTVVTKGTAGLHGKATTFRWNGSMRTGRTPITGEVDR